jgi:hypothetical protein
MMPQCCEIHVLFIFSNTNGDCRNTFVNGIPTDRLVDVFAVGTMIEELIMGKQFIDECPLLIEGSTIRNPHFEDVAARLKQRHTPDADPLEAILDALTFLEANDIEIPEDQFSNGVIYLDEQIVGTTDGIVKSIGDDEDDRIEPIEDVLLRPRSGLKKLRPYVPKLNTNLARQQLSLDDDEDFMATSSENYEEPLTPRRSGRDLERNH